MPFILAHIIQWLLNYRYVVLFPLMIVEGPIATVVAGFLTSIGTMNVFIAYAVIIAGDLTGDSLYYLAGRKGGEQFVARWGKYIGINASRAQAIKKLFDAHGGKTLMIGKISHGIGSIFLVGAGLSKMPYGRFLFFNLIASIFKSLALLLIGFYFGQAIIKINHVFEFVSAITISIVIAGVIVYLNITQSKKEPVPHDQP